MVGDKGKVIAFEPDSGNFRKLEEEIRRYHAKNVIAINKGLWSENATLKFYEKRASTSSFFFDEKSTPRDSIEEVPVVRLDDELKEMGITKINFLKLDVEGAEIEVEGAEETLKNNDVHLVIAAYHIVDGEKHMLNWKTSFLD